MYNHYFVSTIRRNPIIIVHTAVIRFIGDNIMLVDGGLFVPLGHGHLRLASTRTLFAEI